MLVVSFGGKYLTNIYKSFRIIRAYGVDSNLILVLLNVILVFDHDQFLSNLNIHVWLN